MEVKRILRVVLYLIGIALLALIALFAFGLWHVQKTVDAYGIGGGTSTKTTPVEVVIGERGYLIPRNYISAYGKNGINAGFSIDLQLPDMMPRSEENKDSLDSGGFVGKYRVLISDVSKVKPGGIDRIFKGKMDWTVKTEAAGSKYGLSSYLPTQVDPTGRRTSEYYLEKSPSGEITTGLECLPPALLEPTGKYKSIYCRHFYNSNGLLFQATFAQQDLSHWREYQQQLLALFEKFHQDFEKSKQP